MKNGHELTKVALEPISVNDVKTHIQAIQTVMKDVMIRGTHYDTIEGCGDKTVLLKPGAEKILSTFQLGTEIMTEDLGDGYDYRYRIKIRGFHIPTGQTIGYGVGEASTSEKKYAWRVAVCEAEFDATPENRRQIHWKKKWRSEEAESVKQVRQNPADIANTVLKMAKKRAMIDLCLTATACSDIFEQDLDESHIREATGRHEQTIQAPQQTQPKWQTGNQQPQQTQNSQIFCGKCAGAQINCPEKRSDKSPDYKCLTCGAVAWDNNGQLRWKAGKN